MGMLKNLYSKALDKYSKPLNGTFNQIYVRFKDFFIQQPQAIYFYIIMSIFDFLLFCLLDTSCRKILLFRVFIVSLQKISCISAKCSNNIS